jgi:putative IMPACT (imprinted ancient) family translation regulator
MCNISILAYSCVYFKMFYYTSKQVLQDYDDDGETAAGGRLLHLLQIVDAINVVVEFLVAFP